jgi:hypothetical protein
MCGLTPDVAEQLRSIRASLRLLEQVVKPTSAVGRTVSDGLQQNVARLDRLLHDVNLDRRRREVG